MKTEHWLGCWQLGFVGLFTSLLLSSFAAKALPQSTPSNIQVDDTLGTESSQIIQNYQGQPLEVITGGATRSINLFHSFREFNVSEGRGTYFFSPNENIQNILARVTGGTRSEILGTLGTFGSSQPNLFLLNPNGIIFGENASLNIGGSFVATTANGIQFGLGIFSATNPEAPSSLLTINPKALFFNQINKTASIQNNSITPAGKDPAGVDVLGLRVPDGKSLLLVGGNVSMDAGWAIANGGRIELGGLAEAGSIGIREDGNDFSLSFPDSVQRGDISLTNGAVVDVIGGGGSIAVNARNLDILDSSGLFGGIGQGLGTTGTQAGNITVNTTGQIKLAGTNSLIFNSVQEEAVGNAGDITINTSSLEVTGGAQIDSFTRGRGNAGNITIQARDVVTFDGVDSNGFPSASFSNVSAGATGNGGSINITARSLSLTNGGLLGVDIREASDTLPSGQGIGGTVNINIRDAFTISGQDSGVFANLGAGAVGRGGDVNIQAENLFIRDGGEIISSTLGKGDSGKISITARDTISLDTSGIYSNVQQSDAVGNSGGVNITTGSLSVINGAQINSFTRGRGNAGNITIQARDAVTFDGTDSDGNYSGIFSDVETGAVGRGGDIDIQAGNVFIKNGAEISSSTSGKGDSGKISITTRDTVSLSGQDIISGILNGVGSGGVGNSGGISINTGSLSVTNGAQINSFTRGRGNAGNITIQARDAVTFDGVGSNRFLSGSFSGVDTGAIGNGGSINITAGSLFLTNGGQLQVGVNGAANTLLGGRGIGGTLSINVRDALTIGKGSGVFATLGVGAIGRGGDVNIQAGNLFTRDGGQIISSTFGKGDSGNISITARDTISLDTKGIYSNVQQSSAVGNSGGININTGLLSVTNGAQINSFTRGQGNAGNITIQARDAVTFDGTDSDGNDSGVSSNVLAGATGNGGSISITAGSLSLTNGGRLRVGVNGASNTRPGGQGNSGNLNVNVRDALTIGKGSGVFATLGTGAIGRSGDVNIQAGNLFVRDGGQISSSTFGRGDSGKISITVLDIISLDNGSIYSNVAQSDAVGDSGGINMTTGSLSVINGAQISSFTRGRGNAGNITIQARDAITFDGVDNDGNYSSVYSNVLAGAIGNGGSINISAGTLSLTNGGRLRVSVNGASNTLLGGRGNGGTLNINVRDALTIGKGSGVFATLGTGAIGRSGDVNIQAGNLFVRDGGQISSSTFGRGDSGNINISTGSLKITNRAGIFANTFGQGNGGNITVEAKDLVEILSDANLESDVQQSARGNSGNITIKTGKLIVRDSQIGPSVFGEGNAGVFKIIASDSVELSGQIRRENDAVGFPGGLFAQIDLLGKGRGGNLSIETRRLSVSDGSKIQTATFGDGDAGNVFIRADEIDLFETEKPNFFNTGIFAGVQTDGRVEAGIIDPRNGKPPVGKGGNLTIETRTLSIRNGAEVFVQTTGEGDAGNIFIRANESVNVTGVSTGTLEGQRTSKITADASERSTGNGGSLTIETPLLNVTDGGFISTSSQGKGTAGDINITANVARLSNGKIIAQTASTDGGNINLNLGQYLLLRNGSQISTNAGTAQQGGDGGNININSKFIIAIPQENSDITANAYSGRGGNVQINSQGIFGIEARSQQTEKSDITASSDLGVAGVISLIAPDNSDIQNSLSELPQNAIDTNVLIANSCIVRGNKRQENSFTITGSGGLPQSPGHLSASVYPTGDVRHVVPSTSSTSWKEGDPIVEPTGVYRLGNGQLVLSRECR